MSMSHRVHRRLAIEELEPRFAPAPFVLSLTGTTTYPFTDADGDDVLVTLTGGKKGVVEIADAANNPPVGADIASVLFINADAKTSLVFSIVNPRGGNSTPAGNVEAGNLIVGGFVVPGSVTSISGGQFKNLRLAGDVTGPVSLDRIANSDVFQARSVLGAVSVQNWSGGTFSLTGNLAGILNSDKGIGGAINIAGDMLAGSAINADGKINSITVGGNVAAGASIQSVADVTSVRVNGSGGFLGILDAAGSKGIASLVVATGDLGGSVTTNGPIKGLTVGGNILPATTVQSARDIGTVAVGGSMLFNASIATPRKITSLSFGGVQGVQGAVSAGTTLGNLSLLNGPLSGSVTANSVTGQVIIGGDLAALGALRDATGKTLSVNIGGSLMGELDLEGGIGSLVIGRSVMSAMDMTGDIGLFSVAAGRVGESFNNSQVTIRGSVGRMEGRADLLMAANIHVTRNLGPLSLGAVAGRVFVEGAITGAITVNGDFSGTIQAIRGPIGGPLRVRGDFEQTAAIFSDLPQPQGGVTNSITIDGNLEGLLGVTQGNTGGAIVIGGDITPTGQIVSNGTLRRPIAVGGNLLGRIEVLNAQGTRDIPESPNSSPASPIRIPISTTAGNAVAGDISVPTEADYFTFVVGKPRTGTRLNFAVETLEINSLLQPQLTLFRSDGVTVIAQDAYAAGHHVFLDQVLMPGQYYLRVQAAPGSGTFGKYSLYAGPNGIRAYETEGPDTSQGFASPGQGTINPLFLGTAGQYLAVMDTIPTTVRGVLGVNNDVDVYSFYVQVPPTSVTDTRGTATGMNFVLTTPFNQQHQKLLNPTLGIYDKSGVLVSTTIAYNPIAFNDNAEFGNVDSFARADFQRSDYYYAVVMSSGLASNGPYSLTLFKSSFQQLNLATWATDFGAPTEVEPNHGIKNALGLNGLYYAGDLFKNTGGVRVRAIGASLGGINLGLFMNAAIGAAPPDGDRDFYAFRAYEGQELTIKVSQTGTTLRNSMLNLYDANGTRIATNNDLDFGNGEPAGLTPTADTMSAITFRFPKTGTYVAEVRTTVPGSLFGGGVGGSFISGFNNQTYELLIIEGAVWQFDAQDIDIKPGAGLGKEPVRIAGAIASPNEADYFTFTAATGETLSFDLTSIAVPSALNGKLQLLDSNGEVVMESNELFGLAQNPGHPVLTYRLPFAGRFVIKVLGADAATTGAYSLFITKSPAHIAAPITINGNLDGAGGPGTGVIAAPGSLLSALTIGGNIQNRGLAQIGLDISAPLQIGGSLGNGVGGSVWTGGFIRSNGFVGVGAMDGVQGTLFARGVVGSPGANAPLRFRGFLNPLAELVVARPGTLTGRAKVMSNNEILTPGLLDVTLYNLDGSGNLSGPITSVFYNPTVTFQSGQMVYRANRDYSDILPHTPTDVDGAFSQVNVFWQINRYYSYLSFLGYPEALARSNSAIVDVTTLPNNAFYDPYSQGMEFGIFSIAQNDPAGHMADVVLHELNHGLNDALIKDHYWLAYPFALTIESGSAEEGLADYRATSFLNEPRIGVAAAGILNDRITDNFYRFDPRNIPSNVSGNQYSLARVLSGAFWDMRSVIGQQAADSISMRFLEVLDRRLDSRWPIGNTIDVTFRKDGVVGTNIQVADLPGLIYAADQELYGGANRDAINRALALHGMDTYNFASPFPYYITTPSDVNARIVRTYTLPLPGAASLNVTFDNMVTKIEQGERLIIYSGTSPDPANIVLNYTPDFPPPGFGTPDYGRALQGRTVVVPGNSVTIELQTDFDVNPLNEQSISFGFLVTSITDPGPAPVIRSSPVQQQIQYITWQTGYTGGSQAPFMGAAAPQSFVGASAAEPVFAIAIQAPTESAPAPASAVRRATVQARTEYGPAPAVSPAGVVPSNPAFLREAELLRRVAEGGGMRSIFSPAPVTATTLELLDIQGASPGAKARAALLPDVLGNIRVVSGLRVNAAPSGNGLAAENVVSGEAVDAGGEVLVLDRLPTDWQPSDAVK